MSARKQILLYIDFKPKDDRPSRQAKPHPVDFKEEDVHHVWTLYRHQNESAPPELPYVPRHHQNAFLEDYIHDWNIDHKGNFLYASRVIDESVWVLVEMKTDEEKAERERKIRKRRSLP